MDNQYPHTTPEEKARRRAERIAARKARERMRQRKILLSLTTLITLAAVIALAWFFFSQEDNIPPDSVQPEDAASVSATISTQPAPELEPESPYAVSATADTFTVGEELPSQYAILIDLNYDSILAEKDAYTVVSPASMTKILTVLVAAEAIQEESALDDTVVIDYDITDYCYRNDCSVVGYAVGEAVTVRDLFYGTILPSGADAALALAEYIAGSHEEFVVLMNEKAEELGLSDTAHFTNCIGLYNEDNVCTVYDMALILKAALDNELARQVLSTRTYDMPPSEHHVDGLSLSNWFLRRIEDHIGAGIEVLSAKTGYVSQSGNCAASYAETSDGGRFICVTANAVSSWRCIKDHVQLYNQFLGVPEDEA